MKYVIVGTAGHIDHGKTVLVKALTGVDTDRLKEEKKRGISIELGFAPLVLPGGRKLGLVDVPGHERFVRQMLAGVGGMDLVMLVVAADEGVMPQTKEHLDIIDLLQIKKGIVVITKTDLVDEEWLQLVKEDIVKVVEGTILESAPIIPVSAIRGEGISELIHQLEILVDTISPRLTTGSIRLPVDRVFTVTGFGTVVTGTLWTGTIKLGDELEIQPQGIKTKVRNIQVHGQTVKQAQAGQRVALNLAGIDADSINRGSTLLTPGFLRPTYRLDAKFKLLDGARTLSNRTRVRFYLGTCEALGRIVLLDRDKLSSGETAFVQLLMETPVVANRGDRFILRSYSPMATIGGGQIVDPYPKKHRRFQTQVLEALRLRLEGSPEDVLSQVIKEQPKGIECKDAALKASLPPEEAKKLLFNMEEKGIVVLLSADDDSYVLSKERYLEWWEKTSKALIEFHKKYPLRPGLAREELRSRFFPYLTLKLFQVLLGKWADEGLIGLDKNFVFHVGFTPQLDNKQKEILKNIEKRYLSAHWQPPSFNEIAKELKLSPLELEEYTHYLNRKGVLVKITDEFYWHKEAFNSACDLLKDKYKKGSFTLADVRDTLGSSRKYVLPFLEYLDRVKITRRQGDERVLIHN
ncbi:MAG: selenocysteine-specific elongation factor [Clostridia bacterium]|nr:selenocysteine-specific elongation factor [Clostridia bacterium]